MNNDPRVVLDTEPMGRLQVLAVVLCVLLTAVDGFDVLSISFAAPGIAEEWGIDRAALGLVLSMELIGMGVGSLTIGNLADAIGRRPTILGCLVLMSGGMLLASTAASVYELSAYRLATGLGIGGMLAATNAMAAEFSNARHRNLAVTLMAAGYPLGVVVGGPIVSVLLATHDWRVVFVVGALATAVFVPLVWFFLPESVSFLIEKRPRGALERVNRTLVRMGHTGISTLPEIPHAAPARSGIRELFTTDLARTTILLTLAYFMHIMTFYFLVKWIPKIVVDMGFPASMAGGVLVWANLGGITGAVTLGLMTHRFGLRGLVIGALLAGSVMVSVFGQGQPDLAQLSLIAALAGACTNAGVVGLYAMFAQSFPTHVRAGGTGFAIGFGRGGAALGPILAGLLFAAGNGLGTVAFVMAGGSVIGVIALLFLHSPVANAARDGAG